VGLGAGLGMGGTFGQMASQMGQYINPQNSASTPQASGSVCPSCGQPVAAGAKFCSNCGAKLVCSNCGNAIVPGAKFCPNCGHQI
ncbi:MAG: zinc-ribbon domain-containing protein, partial [Synergistaceae bacterium]|nr:zinc-ribbon domain-containing protein [Synergistaceae bacterium]